MFAIKFKKSAIKELEKIDVAEGKTIWQRIHGELANAPDKAGKPLRGNLKDFWSYRVGSYRVIYRFNANELWVLVVRVAHRKDVYG